MTVSWMRLSPVCLFLIACFIGGKSQDLRFSEHKSSINIYYGDKHAGNLLVTSNGRALNGVDCGNSEIMCRDYGSTKIYAQKVDKCVHKWGESGDGVTEMKSTYLITDHLYGGPEQLKQDWPLDNFQFTDYSYVTKEEDHQGFAERYWLTSGGTYYYVEAEAPLFLQQNVEGNNTLQFIYKNKPPYLTSRPLIMNESICFLENARVAHMHAVENFLKKPTGIPDERMIRYPIWSTWARYKADVNEAVVLKYANEILENGFENSQLEIDDLWEKCYGSLTFDENKFPDMKNLSNVLKEKGFRVTLWVHPFINPDCSPFYESAKSQGYLAQNTDGSYHTTWWNGEAGIRDVTNPEAAKDWVDRLKDLMEKNGIDGLKFDAGETSWLPQVPKMTGNILLQPNLYTQDFLDIVAQFGTLSEARVGFKTQHHPFLLRMLDKDTNWEVTRNGLPTLITTLLQMNMIGYPFVLPDMVGGNAYAPDGEPSKELFIRWLQANVFMPTIQYSFVPWDYDNETIEICRYYTQLHAEYADKIIEIMKNTVKTGAPVNPPIWWIDPEDETAQIINDEFLLGEDILVAPVVVQGAQKRNIYLPRGLWKDKLRGTTIQGPTWLKDYPVALNELPYFEIKNPQD